jgi:hypothetical protein
MEVIILARGNQNYPSVAPAFQGGLWGHGAEDFWFPTLATILDPAELIILDAFLAFMGSPITLWVLFFPGLSCLWLFFFLFYVKYSFEYYL